MLPLERFNAVWRPDEPERLRPVYVERVTIREALRQPNLARLLGSVELVEPTFQARARQPSFPFCSFSLSFCLVFLAYHRQPTHPPGAVYDAVLMTMCMLAEYVVLQGSKI